MTLEQCYTAIGGDYPEVLRRLRMPKIIQKFVFKFLTDENFEKLCREHDAGNYEDAFRAAHTLKGVCQNLAFVRLYESTTAVTEELRNGEPASEQSMARIKADYQQTVDAIHELQASQQA